MSSAIKARITMLMITVPPRSPRIASPSDAGAESSSSRKLSRNLGITVSDTTSPRAKISGKSDSSAWASQKVVDELGEERRLADAALAGEEHQAGALFIVEPLAGELEQPLARGKAVALLADLGQDVVVERVLGVAVVLPLVVRHENVDVMASHGNALRLDLVLPHAH